MFYTTVQYSKDTRAASLEKFFAIKDELWKYECEGRFVSFGKQKFYSLREDQKENSTGITKIIFGLETPKENKTLLWQLLDNKNPKIAFFEALRKKGQYSYFQFKFGKYTEKVGKKDAMKTT